MITQGVPVTGRCDACGGTTTLDVGQFFHDGRLHWGTEGRCVDCPNAWCEQNWGSVTPEHIRQALLRAHGPALLRLSGDAPSLVPVIQALRDAGPVTLGEARDRATRLADEGLFGTLVEMEVLALFLRRRGVEVTVSPVPAG